MVCALAVQELTRAAFLAGAMCSGLATEPYGAGRIRVSGSAACVLPEGVKVSGEALILEWRDSVPAPTVLVIGDAKVQSKHGSFSAREAWLRYRVRDARLVLDEVGFYVTESHHMELACNAL
jgi:hypothetical protein